jgi:hypothetical protein
LYLVPRWLGPSLHERRGCIYSVNIRAENESSRTRFNSSRLDKNWFSSKLDLSSLWTYFLSLKSNRFKFTGNKFNSLDSSHLLEPRGLKDNLYSKYILANTTHTTKKHQPEATTPNSKKFPCIHLQQNYRSLSSLNGPKQWNIKKCIIYWLVKHKNLSITTNNFKHQNLVKT